MIGSLRASLPVLLGELKKLRHRALAIAVAQICAVAGTLLFVLFLPDSELRIVVALMAIAGFISSTAVSNNTAKIYSNIRARPGMSFLSGMAFVLFALELVTALVLVAVLAALDRLFETSVTPLQLVFLALASSSGSVIAFTKFDDVKFIRFNYIRAISALFRVAAVFWAVGAGLAYVLPEILAISFLIPTTYCTFVTFSAWRNARIDRATKEQEGPLDPLGLVKEYLWGIPVALSRAFVNQGLIVAAVQLLDPTELRIFRFLLIPRDALSKLFNAALPLVFDRMYVYRPRPSYLLGVAAAAACASLAWFAICNVLLAASWVAAPAFVIYMMLNLTVFSMLPVVWRTIHREEASRNTVVVVLSSAIAAAVFWYIEPRSVTAILVVMSIFLLTYVLGTALIAQAESAREAKK